MLILETHRSGETGICRGASPSNRTIGVLEKNLAEFLGKIGVRVAGIIASERGVIQKLVVPLQQASPNLRCN